MNNLFTSNESGKIDDDRKFVVTTFEKHCACREKLLGFPRRALHTNEWVYIKNYEPDRWPAGGPDVLIPDWGFYGDIDPSGIKSYFTDHEDDIKALFDLNFGKVPGDELYNKKTDPDMINNLAVKPEYHNKLNQLRQNLELYLKDTKDPRAKGTSPWDNYNYDKPFGKVVKK